MIDVEQKMIILRFSLTLLIAASISGCGNQYWYRGDSISLNHGDAVRSNIAVQVPDPWPKKSENTNIPMDPVKAQYAVDCYRLGKKPSDSLGTGTWGFNTSANRGGGQGGGATTCQETGAKPAAPEGTRNWNIERSNNETGNVPKPQQDNTLPQLQQD